MIKLTATQEITPYQWVHPDEERWLFAGDAVDVLRRAQAPMDGAGDCGHPDSREGPAGHPVKAINSRVEKRKAIRCPALCMSAGGQNAKYS